MGQGRSEKGFQASLHGKTIDIVINLAVEFIHVEKQTPHDLPNVALRLGPPALPTPRPPGLAADRDDARDGGRPLSLLACRITTASFVAGPARCHVAEGKG